MNKDDVKKIEKVIGYIFKNKKLLQQAFVRKSYAEENGGEHNEVLEFIGDKVLDVKIVELLSYKYGDVNDDQEYENDYSEGKLTELKKRLVEKKMLASRIDLLDLSQYLIMGKGDIEQGVIDSPSVKEDLFEAIIGAVAIDSDYDYQTLDEVIELMLDPDYYLDNDFDESNNYVNLVQEWSLKENGELPEYSYQEGLNRWYAVLDLYVDGYSRRFGEYGDSKSEARMNVAQKAYQYLDSNDLLFTIRDEIDEPSFELAINQLQELAQKGYFSIPEYQFEETYDDNGNPCWKCSCIIKEFRKYCCATSSSKKQAKKQAAWAMLKEVLKKEETSNSFNNRIRVLDIN